MICLLLACGCKKYPEGGTHFNARWAFRNEHTTCWDIARYEVNGIDSTFAVVSSGDMERLKGAFCFFESRYLNYYTLWQSS